MPISRMIYKLFVHNNLSTVYLQIEMKWGKLDVKKD